MSMIHFNAGRLFHDAQRRRHEAEEDEQLAWYIIINSSPPIGDVLRYVMKTSGGRADPERLRRVYDTLLDTGTPH